MRRYYQTIIGVVFLISLVLFCTTNGGAIESGEAFQEHLILAPGEYGSFPCSAQTDYSYLRITYNFLSEVSWEPSSEFRMILLNTTQYQKFLNGDNYISIWEENEKNDHSSGSSSGTYDIPAGLYRFVLNHTSGKNELDMEFTVIFANSREEAVSIEESLREPYYFSLPSFFVLAVSITGFLSIIAFQRKDRY
ncbi:MAG: hypothetical protein ACFFC7_16125 [Candidatus Hermodarchaeota archaeon]